VFFGLSEFLCGQIDRESTPFSRGTLHLYLAPVVLDDFVRYAESQASPLADLLGRVEGLEDVGEYLRRNALPVVLDGDQDLVFLLFGSDPDLPLP